MIYLKYDNLGGYFMAKDIFVVGAALLQDDKVLVSRRNSDRILGDLWEFPGGKIEPGETGEACIVRECREELGVEIFVERELEELYQEYPEQIVHLYFYLCQIKNGVVDRREHKAIAWITKDQIESYMFCPADKKFLERLGLI